jgi:hypothetical protein
LKLDVPFVVTALPNPDSMAAGVDSFEFWLLDMILPPCPLFLFWSYTVVFFLIITSPFCYYSWALLD